MGYFIKSLKKHDTSKSLFLSAISVITIIAIAPFVLATGLICLSFYVVALGLKLFKG